MEITAGKGPSVNILIVKEFSKQLNGFVNAGESREDAYRANFTYVWSYFSIGNELITNTVHPHLIFQQIGLPKITVRQCPTPRTSYHGHTMFWLDGHLERKNIK